MSGLGRQRVGAGRIGLAVLLAAALAVLIAQPAAADSVISTDEDSRFVRFGESVLNVVGGGGTDEVKIASHRDNRGVFVRDATGTSTDDADCGQLSPILVSCSFGWPDVRLDVDLGAGDDTLEVATIRGLYYRAQLSGGAGDDVLVGGPDDDGIDGDAGNDRVNGARGKDKIGGGQGRDRLVGDGGGDRIDGDAGADVLVGKRGGDVLTGSGGRDVAKGSGGNDRIHFEGDKRRDRRIDCGRGEDFAFLDRRDPRWPPGCERWAIVREHDRRAG